MFKKALATVAVLFSLTACNNAKGPSATTSEQTEVQVTSTDSSANATNAAEQAPESEGKETIVTIETSLGTMKARLYNGTPLHRDNFIKLANSNFYNGLLFHRVIKGFMIQGGDPDSKNAPAGKELGAGENGYQIPAEFRYPKYIHKRGALAAARTGDEINPEKKSSGCQFYIVDGKKYSDGEFYQLEEQMKNQIMMRKFNELAQQHRDEVNAMMQAQDQMGLETLQQRLISECEAYYSANPFRMDAATKNIYKEVGGVPFLDGDYTVFGEVFEGLEVIDKIASVKTGAADRPVEDVKIIKVTVEK